MTDIVPVPPALLRRLWIGLAAAAASLVLTTVEGLLRPGFDVWQQAVSALSLGPGGWLQMLNLVAFGAAVLTTVLPWRRILAGGRGETAYPIATAIIGACFIVVGIVRQDPAPGYDPEALGLHAPTPLGLVHISVAGIAVLASVVGFFIMAARFARDPQWRSWALPTRLVALSIVTCVIVYGVWSTQSHGFAGTFERGAMLLPVLWTFAFLRRLHHGTPFMISSTSTRA